MLKDDNFEWSDWKDNVGRVICLFCPASYNQNQEQNLSIILKLTSLSNANCFFVDIFSCSIMFILLSFNTLGVGGIGGGSRFFVHFSQINAWRLLRTSLVHFLAFRVLWSQNRHISVLNLSVNHLNTQLSSETKKQASLNISAPLRNPWAPTLYSYS